MRKIPGQDFVNCTLKGNGKTRKFGQFNPFPGVELRVRMCIQLDVGVLTEKFQGEPFLGLSPVTALPGFTLQVPGEIILQPVRVLAKNFGVGGTDFLQEFTQNRRPRVFPFVNPALWQLPRGICHTGAPANQHPAIGPEQDRTLSLIHICE